MWSAMPPAGTAATAMLRYIPLFLTVEEGDEVGDVLLRQSIGARVGHRSHAAGEAGLQNSRDVLRRRRFSVDEIGVCRIVQNVTQTRPDERLVVRRKFMTSGAFLREECLAGRRVAAL